MSSSIHEFPFPFEENEYRYKNNSVLLDPPRSITVDDRYEEELDLKRRLLVNHHDRCYQSLSHSLEAQWEVLRLIFYELAQYNPEDFQLKRHGNEWIFQNHRLQEEERFIFRDTGSIELEPLDLAGRHVQEDLILMGDRHGDLFLDAGQLCFPSNWSLVFTLGMDFKSIHDPVPGIQQHHFINKVHRFIKRIQPGQSWERKNWSITIGPKLDTHLETYAEWGKLRDQVTEDNAGDKVHLRVEVQRLYRLPVNNDVLFTIHTYLLPLVKLVTHPAWLRQFYQNIISLDQDIADYKGISHYQEAMLAYMERWLPGERNSQHDR
ncbi:MAG: DUF3445 domain-containing protein [Bacillaceae bacterium]|nr:DUF3445 domain-containing protein [Bacillaceae bacterium]